MACNCVEYIQRCDSGVDDPPFVYRDLPHRPGLPNEILVQGPLLDCDGQAICEDDKISRCPIHNDGADVPTDGKGHPKIPRTRVNRTTDCGTTPLLPAVTGSAVPGANGDQVFDIRAKADPNNGSSVNYNCTTGTFEVFSRAMCVRSGTPDTITVTTDEDGCAVVSWKDPCLDGIDYQTETQLILAPGYVIPTGVVQQTVFETADHTVTNNDVCDRFIFFSFSTPTHLREYFPTFDSDNVWNKWFSFDGGVTWEVLSNERAEREDTEDNSATVGYREGRLPLIPLPIGATATVRFKWTVTTDYDKPTTIREALMSFRLYTERTFL